MVSLYKNALLAVHAVFGDIFAGEPPLGREVRLASPVYRKLNSRPGSGRKVSNAKEMMGKMLVKKVMMTRITAMTYTDRYRPSVILEIWPDLPVTVV